MKRPRKRSSRNSECTNYESMHPTRRWRVAKDHGRAEEPASPANWWPFRWERIEHDAAGCRHHNYHDDVWCHRARAVSFQTDLPPLPFRRFLSLNDCQRVFDVLGCRLLRLFAPEYVVVPARCTQQSETDTADHSNSLPRSPPMKVYRLAR